MASAAGLELAGSTIAGWFETWSVVPAWEKFEVLLKALAAEKDADWRTLHHAALTADRRRKQEERRRKKPGEHPTPVSAEPLAPHRAPDRHSPVLDPTLAAMSWVVAVPPGQAPAGPLPVVRQLPMDVAHFTGRDAELTALDARLIHDDGRRPTAMAIAVITGTAGVGKTALAVRWAHRVRDRFPEGQLFVNPRGYDSGPPMAPEQALEEFLRALDVPAERIPAGLGARAALYRSLLDGRRVVIVLDNANAAEQVRPLLPGSATCRVVVTSRSRLSGLIAHDGASRVTVDLLPPAEAIALLGDVIADHRVAAEPESTVQLASRCAYLPLALRLAAERAAAHPHLTLAELAGELTVVHDRLDLLATAEEDEATALRAVFSWSYQALAPPAARVFRLLGLHAGPDISTWATAALTNTTPTAARRRLETLAGTHLIEETGKDRYRLHDLLRVYAAERATAEDSDADRAAAVRRVLIWYLQTGDGADRILNPHRRRVPGWTVGSADGSWTVGSADGSWTVGSADGSWTVGSADGLDPPALGCAPLEFTTYGQALDWCEAERANLVAAIRHAAQLGEHGVASKLPLALRSFFNLRKYWADLISTHHIGLTAALHLHDREAQAWSRGGLGMAYLDLRQYDEALDHCQRALHICQDIGDSWGEAVALLGLAKAYVHLGRYNEALDHSQQALRICQDISDPWSHTFALLAIGIIHRKLTHFNDALDYFQRTLTVVRSVHYPAGKAMTLHNLGDT